MSTFTAKLPLEVIDLIIDYVGINDLNDESSSNCNIKACALVSRSLLPRARTYIFSSINIDSKWPSRPLWSPFEHLISRTPAIAYYVTSLYCLVDDRDFEDDRVKECDIERLIRPLNSLTRLKNLTLSFYGNTVWEDLKIIKEPLLNLIHLPTLCSLILHNPYKFQLSDLTLCRGLKHLGVTGIPMPDYTEVGENTGTYQKEPSHLESFDGMASTCLLQLCTARRTDGRPIVDITGLKNLRLTIINEEDFDDILESFKHLHQLTSLEMLNCHELFDAAYPSPRLSLPSLQTLQHVHLRLDTGYADVLVREFASISGKNVIESIKLSVDYLGSNLGLGRYGNDDWSALDQVFKHSGWEKLKLFSLEAIVCFGYKIDNEVINKSMEKLRMHLATNLKGFASCNTIVLNLKVSSYY